MAKNQTTSVDVSGRVLKEKSASVFDDTREITRRFGVAVKEAILDHKRAGNPIAVWRDGKVVVVAPGDIRWRGRRREPIVISEDESPLE